MNTFRTSTICMAVAAASLLTGCGYSSDGEKPYSIEQTKGTKSTQNGKLWGYTIKGNTDHHNNKQIFLDMKTSDAITAMKGIAVAHVVLTDQNAYVALATDTRINNDKGRTDTNNVGTSEGVYDIYTGSPYMDNRKVVSQTNSDHTTSSTKDILPNSLKQAVAAKVRTMNPYVLEVFISANRDFLNAMNDYYMSKTLGKTSKNRVEHFNMLARRTFPMTAEDKALK